MEKAVNLVDLTKYADRDGLLNPVMLLLRPILTQQTVPCEGDRWDGTGVLVQADVTEERWEAIKEILRGKIPRYALRMYEARQVTTKTWKRV